MDQYLMQMEQDTVNYNTVKDMVIDKLVREGLITEEQGDDFMHRCQVVVVKNGWFKRWCSKFATGTEQTYAVRILEMYENKMEVK